ncbi:MAG: MFS transporter, partial [Chloroflexi bacterium]|nr:MFS transporter [Chloroflexota bacterium]
AVAGTLGAGFLLIPVLGVIRTALFAGACNVAAAALAFLSAGKVSAAPPDEAADSGAETIGPPIAWAAFVTGATAMILEVAWTRLLATPLGALSDRWGRLPVLIAGYTAFGLVYAGWAMASRPWHGAALFMLYGIYAAATEGVARALVTDVVPQQQRGTALGWFNGLTGLAALPANLLGGWLWANVGAGATFALGAWLGLVSAALLLAWAPWLMGARPAMSPREPLAGGS